MPSLDDFFVVENDENPAGPSQAIQETSPKTSRGANKNDEEEDEEDDEDDSDDQYADNDSVDLRHHGINPKFNLALNLDLTKTIEIKKTDENNAIIENAKDAVRLINTRFLPMVKKWAQICTKHSTE